VSVLVGYDTRLVVQGMSGSAGAFCRVGAQRLAPSASGLQTRGAYGEVALRVLRNYAAT